MRKNTPRRSIRWRYLPPAAASLFFAYVGVETLLAAYRLPDPFSFVMAFFAACLIILISLSLAVGLVIRAACPGGEPGKDDP